MQTGERAPLWCTLLVFTRYDGKWFVPPIIFHKAKEYSQDTQYNIILDLIIHHKPSGYMDKYGWLKYMTWFYNVCGTSLINNQILLFDGHAIHLYNGALREIRWKKNQPFVLTYDNSIYYQPNDNGPNAKLKSLYNVSKIVWMLKYGQKRFHLTTWAPSWLNHGMPSRC